MTCQNTISYASSTLSNLEVLCNFPNKPLEGQLPDQQLSALLVLADLTVKLQVTQQINHPAKH
jgi:hypothetical protein